MNQHIINFNNTIVEFINQRLKWEAREAYRQSYGNYSFNKEMNTFYFKMPRQCGNSLLSVEVARMLGNPCFIISEEKYARNLVSNYPEINDVTFTSNDLKQNLDRLMQYDFIFVLDPSTFNENFLDKLWQDLSPKFFLFFG